MERNPIRRMCLCERARGFIHIREGMLMMINFNVKRGDLHHLINIIFMLIYYHFSMNEFLCNFYCVWWWLKHVLESLIFMQLSADWRVIKKIICRCPYNFSHKCTKKIVTHHWPSKNQNPSSRSTTATVKSCRVHWEHATLQIVALVAVDLRHCYYVNYRSCDDLISRSVAMAIVEFLRAVN